MPKNGCRKRQSHVDNEKGFRGNVFLWPVKQGDKKVTTFWGGTVVFSQIVFSLK